ncbi:MAG TPA: hypothetical protein DCQ34_01795, partial [Chitinophagaceae bacterium]|nr:hypothetical protein [Chitinophagaceae bacterium]
MKLIRTCQLHKTLCLVLFIIMKNLIRNPTLQFAQTKNRQGCLLKNMSIMKRQFIQFFSIWVFLLCLGPGIQAQVVFPPDFEQTVRRDYEQLSDPEETFDAYFSYRKTAFIDKYNIEHRLAAAYEPCQGNHTPCGNGDFETGLDSNEWSGAYGVYANYPNALTDGFSPLNLALSNSNARQTLVAVGNDPITGISQVAPGGSTQAIRLGNTAVGRGVELISKRFTVM